MTHEFPAGPGPDGPADPLRIWEERRGPLEAERRQALLELAADGSPESGARLLDALRSVEALNGAPGGLDPVLDALLDCMDDPEREARLQRMLAETTRAQDPTRSRMRELQLETSLRIQAWGWRSPEGESLPALERRVIQGTGDGGALAWRQARQAGFPLAATVIQRWTLATTRARALGYEDLRALELGLAGVDPESLDHERLRLLDLSGPAWRDTLAGLAVAAGGAPDQPCWALGDSLGQDWLGRSCLPGPPELGLGQCRELGRELLDSLGLLPELCATFGPAAGTAPFCAHDLCLVDGEGRPRPWMPGPGLELPRFLALLGESLCLSLVERETDEGGHSRHGEMPALVRLACGRLFARLAARGPLLAPWLPAGVTVPERDCRRTLALYGLRRLLRDTAFEQELARDPSGDLDQHWARLDRELLWHGHHRPSPPPPGPPSPGCVARWNPRACGCWRNWPPGTWRRPCCGIWHCLPMASGCRAAPGPAAGSPTG